MTVTISTVDAQFVYDHIGDFVSILRDSVDSGASVGFLPPLTDHVARSFWQGIAEDVAAGTRVTIVAHDGNTLCGTGQLGLATKLNARHRAEVQKVLVHSAYRRRGIARALMLELERIAHEYERSLLVLDTLQDGGAEALYESCGYTRAGVIPNFARVGDGSLQPTVYYYKILES